MSTGRRIVSRTLAAVWHQKTAIILGAVVTAGLGGSMALRPAQQLSPQPSADCADTTIAALAHKTNTALQQAYQCMDQTYRQRVSEQQFTTQVQSATSGPVTKVERIGSHPEANGAELVYFALDSGDQSIGYIVYLGPNGKVQKIE
jgi:hypothetical protein